MCLQGDDLDTVGGRDEGVTLAIMHPSSVQGHSAPVQGSHGVSCAGLGVLPLPYMHAMCT